MSVDLPLIIYAALTGVIVILIGAVVHLRRRNKSLERAYALDLENARQQTVEAAKAKDAFLANVSHEIRTPMNAIIGLSHILLQSDVAYDQKVTLFKIKRSAEHLLNVTNDVLDYSKLEAGKLEIEATEAETDALLGNLADIVTPSAVEKGLDLVFDVAPGVPEKWRGDPLRVSQILINLLNNAVKFTREGHVRLSVAYDAQTGLTFTVTDTGIGISDEQQQRLFKAFSQADGSISRKYGGTGLGLVISNELATMMGSSITLHSTPRHGATFTFALPITLIETQADRPAFSRRLMENKSLLILDRCELNGNALAETLRHYGADATVADTIDSFGQQLALRHYDAVFIDSRMLGSLDPQTIRTHSDAVVVLQYDILRSNENTCTADAILNKPFTPLQLLGVMTEIFGQRIQRNRLVNQHVTLDDVRVLAGARILLAEDNEGNAMVVEGLLEGSGIELTVMPDGQKAVEAVMHAKHPFDLILMDINMPVMDGFTATSILREYQKYDGIPIIMMTANITESDLEKALSRGMQDSVSKPVEVEHFYRTLLKYIPPKQPAREKAAKPAAPSPKAPAAVTASLPGVDVQAGLERVNGNKALYRNILKKFAELFGDAVATMERHARNGEWEEGRKLAHNLKGLSGNIGAAKVYEYALETETAFRHEGREIAASLARLKQTLTPLLDALAQRPREESSGPARPKVSREQALNAFTKLKESCAKRKALDAKKIVRKLKTVALPSPLDKAGNTIFEAVEQYRFDVAVSKIDALLKDNP